MILPLVSTWMSLQFAGEICMVYLIFVSLIDSVVVKIPVINEIRKGNLVLGCVPLRIDCVCSVTRCKRVYCRDKAVKPAILFFYGKDA